MKKNPLEEIYTSKVLVSESVPSNKVKGDKELEDGMNLKKARPVAGQGPEAAKKDLDTPKEMHGTEVHEPKVLKDSIMEKPTKSFEGSFEKLFKATINEQFPGEEDMGTEEVDMEMDVEVPTSGEDMMDELEGEKDEVSDLVSDLRSVMDHLQNILDKISDEAGGEEPSEEEEMEFGNEEDVDDVEDLEMEEEPVKEATELKPLGDKSKVLQNKNNKVGGNPKVHGGKAHSGNIESDPKLKPAKSYDKSLQSPKGKPEVKSTVKRGDFFK
jgi:hypothetical protein